MHEREPPAASEQHREPDHPDHRHADARAHQAEQPREQPERVAPRDRPVVVREQEVRETERERAREADLERLHDVLPAGSEQHEQRRGGRRDPGSDEGAAHHDEEQRRRREVHQHDDEAVREVCAQPERPEEEPVHEHGECHPVHVVPAEQVAEVAGPARGKEVPLVLREPSVPSECEPQGQRGDLHGDEDRGRQVEMETPSARAHAVPVLAVAQRAAARSLRTGARHFGGGGAPNARYFAYAFGSNIINRSFRAVNTGSPMSASALLESYAPFHT